LKRYFSRFGSAIVALSGGIDSAFMLYIASQYIHPMEILAVTVVNEHVFAYEIENARKVADILAVPWKPVLISMEDAFYENDSDRCYWCKKAIMAKMAEIKQDFDVDVIFDGTNLDDTKEERPGRKALKEFGIISPLLGLGLSKSDIFKGIQNTPLVSLDFYNESCVATRIVGKNIKSPLLRKIELSEDLLRHRFRGLRLRTDGKEIYPSLKSGEELSKEDIDIIRETFESV
jgi:uncharacterized protein